MITAMLLATALLQPVGDTTWLRTEGAEVMWESDQNVCALFIFQESDAVGFFWNKTGPTSIVFFNEQWDFSPSETRVAVRIGNNWMSKNGEIDWFQAAEKKNALMVPIRYHHVESLLSKADSVSLRRQGADFELPLDKRKMPRLLKAVATCRKHLK
jgi:hypothetical protein